MMSDYALDKQQEENEALDATYQEQQAMKLNPILTKEDEERLTLEKRVEEAEDRDRALAEGWEPGV